jgi:hypothetical protein
MSKRSQHGQGQTPHQDAYATKARNSQAQRPRGIADIEFTAPDGDAPGQPGRDEAPQHSGWASEQSRQQSLATHSRETRTKMSSGQANTMRLKRGNQPRGGR